jgi:hypothetical protein
LSLARLYSDSVFYDRAREFNDPNFGFSESCSKKIALNKLARMSRVRHNAKSIENRYNRPKFSRNGARNCLKHFAHSTKGPAILKSIKQLINILFCGYRRSMKNASRNLYSSGHRVPQRVINPRKQNNIPTLYILYIDSSVFKSVQVSSIFCRFVQKV